MACRTLGEGEVLESGQERPHKDRIIACGSRIQPHTGCVVLRERTHRVLQAASPLPGCAGLNTGVMLVRNTDWSRRLLDMTAHFGQFPPNMTTEQVRT